MSAGGSLGLIHGETFCRATRTCAVWYKQHCSYAQQVRSLWNDYCRSRRLLHQAKWKDWSQSSPRDHRWLDQEYSPTFSNTQPLSPLVLSTQLRQKQAPCQTETKLWTNRHEHIPTNDANHCNAKAPFLTSFNYASQLVDQRKSFFSVFFVFLFFFLYVVFLFFICLHCFICFCLLALDSFHTLYPI